MIPARWTGMINVAVRVAPGGLLPHSVTPVFLAGPLGGAGNWRSDFVSLLRSDKGGVGDVAIVDPGARAPSSLSVAGRVAWEQDVIDSCAQRGLLILWLGEQREATKMVGAFPRPFGLASMLELGWVAASYGRFDPRRVLIGISASFPSSEYVRLHIANRLPETDMAWTLEGLVSRCVRALTQIRE